MVGKLAESGPGPAFSVVKNPVSNRLEPSGGEAVTLNSLKVDSHLGLDNSIAKTSLTEIRLRIFII